MIRLVCFALLLPALAFAQPATAEIVMLDSIAAVVDDSVIMASELKTQVDDIRRNMTSEGRQLPPENILRSQVLERMISERIQIDQATRMGIRIDDTSLNEALTGIARQNGFSLDEFAEQLRSEEHTSELQSRP